VVNATKPFPSSASIASRLPIVQMELSEETTQLLIELDALISELAPPSPRINSLCINPYKKGKGQLYSTIVK
jgi:hypothetical protein